MEFQTRCVHVGVDKDPAYLSATTPIYPTSTFRWDDLENNRGFDYTRSGNPTRSALEENIASLEGGIDCRATSTGMSAITATTYLFEKGDHIIAGKDIYGGTYRLFADILAHQHLEFSFVDMLDLDALRAAVRPETKGIWIETPSNPLLHVTDMAAVCQVAGEAGAITIADNTFCSPYLQRPFEHGVDVVMHSTTKYLNGHSDVVGGCVVTRHEQHAERIGYITNALGLACSPFDAWLVLRGIKTLGPRMEAHQRAAQAVAEMLEAHAGVTKVFYPGLPGDPGHEVASRQQDGFGAMLSFEVDGGREAVDRVLARTSLFQLAESLGGVESLISYPETMSHASMDEPARRAAGITGGLLRVSCGIEHPDDLCADLADALA
ncbi:MAG TPA: cystathionine gamma-synthase [Planctomycetaceae bacterium]|nr:cystathionine gamma-synthase [Planctomycetaceae bacterium]HCD00626.1 cystathionine gamma-synthase [Planctomycetaceae bacterium]|tara:strand:- start:1456 stop:2592 length:1137 start_codon:yes stop_codon:yes gene_type:complete